jgi:hypothetical protein
MATVTDKLIDSQTRHTVYLLRWAKGTYKQHLNLLDEAQADIAAKIAARAPDDGSFTAKRLDAMLQYTETRAQALYVALSAAVTGDFKDLAAYEIGFQTKAVQAAYPIKLNLVEATGSQIHAAALGRPFQGKVLKDWWADQSLTIRKQYKQALRLGYVEGETIQQITQRLAGVGDMSKRQTEAIIRTAVSHYSQIARDRVTTDNVELFAEEIWSATLDGRTTAICRGRDGNRYPIGKGPKIPAHIGERSQRIPVTKSWKELGFDDIPDDMPLDTRPFVADKRRVKDIPKDQRDQIIGTTTAKSYNEWLKTQPKSFVEDVLGKQKAKLYLDGGLPLDRFVDRAGNELTLEQLAKRESKLFDEVLGSE